MKYTSRFAPFSPILAATIPSTGMLNTKLHSHILARVQVNMYTYTRCQSLLARSQRYCHRRDFIVSSRNYTELNNNTCRCTDAQTLLSSDNFTYVGTFKRFNVYCVAHVAVNCKRMCKPLIHLKFKLNWKQ